MVRFRLGHAFLAATRLKRVRESANRALEVLRAGPSAGKLRIHLSDMVPDHRPSLPIAVAPGMMRSVAQCCHRATQQRWSFTLFTQHHVRARFQMLEDGLPV
ncbi:hypothetical protein MnTg02_01107 [bacterium MnTg02]|nr:hypothetical protein MnTg02_01107 [bacterium MnTg02]